MNEVNFIGQIGGSWKMESTFTHQRILSILNNLMIKNNYTI